MDEKKVMESEKCAESKRHAMSEERKFAILFAATILAARKLIDLDPNKPNMAKGYFVGRAIDGARLRHGRHRLLFSSRLSAFLRGSKRHQNHIPCPRFGRLPPLPPLGIYRRFEG